MVLKGKVMVDLYEDFLTDADVKDIGEYVHSKIGTFIWRPSFAWGDINKGSSNCNSLPIVTGKHTLQYL